MSSIATRKMGICPTCDIQNSYQLPATCSCWDSNRACRSRGHWNEARNLVLCRNFLQWNSKSWRKDPQCWTSVPFLGYMAELVYPATWPGDQPTLHLPGIIPGHALVMPLCSEPHYVHGSQCPMLPGVNWHWCCKVILLEKWPMGWQPAHPQLSENGTQPATYGATWRNLCGCCSPRICWATSEGRSHMVQTVRRRLATSELGYLPIWRECSTSLGWWLEMIALHTIVSMNYHCNNRGPCTMRWHWPVFLFLLKETNGRRVGCSIWYDQPPRCSRWGRWCPGVEPELQWASRARCRYWRYNSHVSVSLFGSTVLGVQATIKITRSKL